MTERRDRPFWRFVAARALRRGSLVVTVDRGRAPVAVRAAVDRPVPVARTEALSAGPERIPGLVKGSLDRVDPDGRHTVSPAALQALTLGLDGDEGSL